MELNNRHMANYKKENYPECLLCNPILSCLDGTICDECFITLDTNISTKSNKDSHEGADERKSFA